MTFTKPSDVSFTQMAQWIDSHNSFDASEQDKLCQYLYLLIYLRSQQFGLFQTYEQLDDFAIYCTSRLLIRLRDTAEAKHIKSITNYIKNIVPLWKSDYIRAYCSGSPDYETTDFDLIDYGDYLIDESSQGDYFKYDVGQINIAVALRKHLQKIPRKKNSSEWQNIYISCLLTITDRIRSATLISQKYKVDNDTEQLSCILRALQSTPVILFHLDETMSNYISTLVNELIHVLSAELTYTIGSKVSPSVCLKNLVAAANNDEDN